MSSTLNTLKAVKEKLKSLKVNTEFKTNKMFSDIGNITTMDELDITRCYGSLLASEEVFKRACAELDNNLEYKVNGFSAEDWKHDLKLALNNLKNKELIEKLTKAQKELEQLLDKEDKLFQISEGLKDLLK